ncbi:AFR173Wp [Eremothecium gossypii ATCC 10895]|uniref:mRNA m(6)A methyltransferase n=1 Tax=Eremothecium gossypii (strain ATCC 10895 / CBS 109.51 / FGSC 9923 / NRRL Y-1056) TaxID=284811 RepID=Q753Z9_EREGS|nr:AFR173Wp [Eremothecium gossypii ATCC 10895]AAS53544.1 AFR173Wp [Eremothecium gossypii ATCC 10895]
MAVNLELVKYLIENHVTILAHPVDGRLKDLYALFCMYLQQWADKDQETPSYGEFHEDLVLIAQVVQGAIGVVCDSIFPEGEQLDYVHVTPLKYLVNRFHPGYYNLREQAAAEEAECAPATLLERLTNALETRIETPSTQALNRLEELLACKLASFRLARERVKRTVPHAPYIPTCKDLQHSSILSTVAYISNNKIVSLQKEKLFKADKEYPGLVQCIQTHIHFIPNLKPQTDLSLGDCSYLDTCHKLNSCRYVHYLQYIPERLMQSVEQSVNQLNETQEKNRRIGFYTHGDCCSSVVKSILPSQWIKCDVRKFDFTILGKFSAVIADPAWNIHMNLPYGTCNDNELLLLPLDILQDEGLLFLWVTGRAIELGKESLMNWGYKVINEISWIKTNQLGRTIVTGRTGHWLNHSKEHLLVGLKGDPEWLNKQIDIDLIISSTRETSRKPDELYGMVERIVGTHARKLEIFGRDHNVRPGWFTIGNQLTGTCIHELDVKRKYENFIATSRRQNEGRAFDYRDDIPQKGQYNKQVYLQQQQHHSKQMPAMKAAQYVTTTYRSTI